MTPITLSLGDILLAVNSNKTYVLTDVLINGTHGFDVFNTSGHLVDGATNTIEGINEAVSKGSLVFVGAINDGNENKSLTWEGYLVLLNPNEMAVLEEIKGCDYYEDRPSCHPADICVDGLSKNQIKGYLSALDKKGVIIECEYPNNIFGWSAII
jgi:hypothetical protein